MNWFQQKPLIEAACAMAGEAVRAAELAVQIAATGYKAAVQQCKAAKQGGSPLRQKRLDVLARLANLRTKYELDRTILVEELALVNEQLTQSNDVKGKELMALATTATQLARARLEATKAKAQEAFRQSRAHHELGGSAPLDEVLVSFEEDPIVGQGESTSKTRIGSTPPSEGSSSSPDLRPPEAPTPWAPRPFDEAEDAREYADLAGSQGAEQQPPLPDSSPSESGVIEQALGTDAAAAWLEAYGGAELPGSEG